MRSCWCCALLLCSPVTHIETFMESPKPTRRVRFTTGSVLYADLDPGTAEIVLPEYDENGNETYRPDLSDLAEVFERLALITGGREHDRVFDAWLEADEDDIELDDCWVVDGTGAPSWYRLARHHVGKAIHVLSSGRYREGNCREMDSVAAKLEEIERLLLRLAEEAASSSGTERVAS